MSRPAGVLVPVFEEDGDVHVVLTRRSARLRNHSGEVSFPGGRVDDGETGVDAALREAHEEIGLHPSAVEIIGELDHLVTFTSKAGIMPFVGVLDGRPTDLRPNPAEVELVLTVPFSELLHEDVFHEEVWHFLGGDRPMYFFDVEGDTVWGATARILHDFLDALTRNVRA